jgi:hypothetical protein
MPRGLDTNACSDDVQRNLRIPQADEHPDEARGQCAGDEG